MEACNKPLSFAAHKPNMDRSNHLLDILRKISFYANAKNIVKFAWSVIRCLASIVFRLDVVVKVSSPAVRFIGHRILSSDFPGFCLVFKSGKEKRIRDEFKNKKENG